MKKITYQILVYSSIAVFILSLIGFIIVLKANDGVFNAWVNVLLALSILSIFALILVQCIYRVTKKPLQTLDQTKTCPKCNAINDKDAEYCKKCGEKFKTF